MYGTEIFVIGEGSEVRCSIVGVAVEGACIEFSRGVKCAVYGRHEGGRDGPVVLQVQFAPLGVDGAGARMVAP